MAIDLRRKVGRDYKPYEALDESHKYGGNIADMLSAKHIEPNKSSRYCSLCERLDDPKGTDFGFLIYTDEPEVPKQLEDIGHYTELYMLDIRAKKDHESIYNFVIELLTKETPVFAFSAVATNTAFLKYIKKIYHTQHIGKRNKFYIVDSRKRKDSDLDFDDGGGAWTSSDVDLVRAEAEDSTEGVIEIRWEGGKKDVVREGSNTVTSNVKEHPKILRTLKQIGSLRIEEDAEIFK